MCGILVTSKNIEDIDEVNKKLKNRGPDHTNLQKINNINFLHNLLHVTGVKIPQPFYSEIHNIVYLFNGEIYNYREFGEYQSDGECILDLYLKHGYLFPQKLDGEFAIILIDFNKNFIITSTDIFGTKPFWYSFEDSNFGFSSYPSSLEKLLFQKVTKMVANTINKYDLESFKLLESTYVHQFDLQQYKDNYDDFNKVLEKAVLKRVENLQYNIIVGLSSGYDSGVIVSILNKYNIKYDSYSIEAEEDLAILNQRIQIGNNLGNNCQLLKIKKSDFDQMKEYLYENAEKLHYKWLQNGRTECIFEDVGAIGTAIILKYAKENRVNLKVFLSGLGGDEIFSTYQRYDGPQPKVFPEKLETIFPWPNFFGNSMRNYLGMAESISGVFSIEGRYPLIDKDLVQEFLWLKPDLKNNSLKAPLDNYLALNKYPIFKPKRGFNAVAKLY